MQIDAEDDEHAYYRPPIEPTTSAGAESGGNSSLSGETYVEAASAAAPGEEE